MESLCLATMSLGGECRLTSCNVLIRCDASPEVGFGHLVRCLALADELCIRHSCSVSFAMVQGPIGAAQVRDKEYLVHLFLPEEGKLSIRDEGQWLQQIVSEVNAVVLILDVRSDLSVQAVRAVRDTGVLIVTLDDPSERRLIADLAFYPPVPQVRRLDWSGFNGQLYIGWEWIVLRPEFTQSRKTTFRSSALIVLVTMGGSDPAGLTLKALSALDGLDSDFETVVVLGSGFIHERALALWLKQARRYYEVRRDVRDMASLMAEVDLAIASFGVTAYELAAMKIPAVYLCLTADHAESAAALVEAGIAMSLGVHDQVKVKDLSMVISVLVDDDDRRKRMVQCAEIVDIGKDSARSIANLLFDRLEACL